MSPSDQPRDEKPRLGITPAQVAGSALAAVSAAVAASFLGVSGTVIGAALGSVVATVGSATYTASLRRGTAAVKRTAQTVRTITPRGTVLTVTKEPADDAPRESFRQRMSAALKALPWPRVAIAAVSVLVVALIVITAFEYVTGRPVSSITGHTSRHGTTLSHVVSHSTPPQHKNGGATNPTPTPAPSGAPSAAPSSTPSAAPSAAPSETPSAAPSSEPSTEPSGEPSTGASDEPSPQP